MYLLAFRPQFRTSHTSLTRFWMFYFISLKFNLSLVVNNSTYDRRSVLMGQTKTIASLVLEFIQYDKQKSKLTRNKTEIFLYFANLKGNYNIT